MRSNANIQKDLACGKSSKVCSTSNDALREEVPCYEFRNWAEFKGFSPSFRQAFAFPVQKQERKSLEPLLGAAFDDLYEFY